MTTTTLLELRPEQITTHGRNPRMDVGDVTELAASMLEIGLLEPLIVAPNGGDGLCPDCGYVQSLTPGGDLVDHTRHQGKAKEPCTGSGFPPKVGDDFGLRYRLIAGHRRFAANDIAKLETLPCLLRSDLDTEPRQIEAMLVENLQRTDLSPIEEAAAYEQLVIFGYDPPRIAKATGRSRSTVDRRLGLMKLPQEIRAKIHSHELTLSDAETLIEFSDNPKDLERASLYIGTSNWQWISAEIRRRRAAEAKRPRVLKELKDAGVKVVKAKQGWEYDLDAKVRPVTVLAKPDGSDYKKPATEHADCPGHVAVVDDMANVKYGCNQPDKHPKRARTSPTAAVDDGSDQKLRENLETAQDVRLAFLTDALSLPKPGDDLVKTGLRHLVLVDLERTWDHGEGSVTICRLLGLPVPDIDRDDITVEDEEAAFAAVTEAIGKFTTPRLVQALLACETVRRELQWPELTEPLPWQRRDDGLLTYMSLLTDLGYQQSDVERDLLEPADDAAEEKAS